MSFVTIFLALLAGCGSTSKIKPAASASKSVSDYQTIYVVDFTDQTETKIKNEAKRAQYLETVRVAGGEFANMIAGNLEKTKNPPSVLRAAPEDAAGSLRIEGEITTFKRGNAVAKLLLPFAGSTKFNANVRFVDHDSNTVIAEITVDKNSNPLGGGYAMTQTTNAFMKGAADKIAEQVELARNPK